MIERIQEVYEYVTSLWYDVAFISLYGSQNYWMATEESDYDWKVAIMPTLEDLVNQTKPVSTTLEFKWGQIDLKDIRVFVENITKMNPVYIETLYSDYSQCYIEEFKDIIAERECLMKEMWWLFVKWAYGQVLQKVKAFSHPYPTTVHKIEKWWYDPKQLHHICRLAILINDFTNWDVKFIPDEEERNMLIWLKIKPKSLGFAEILRDDWSKFVEEMYKSYPPEMSFDAKNRVIQISRDIIIKRILWKK